MCTIRQDEKKTEKFRWRTKFHLLNVHFAKNKKQDAHRTLAPTHPFSSFPEMFSTPSASARKRPPPSSTLGGTPRAPVSFGFPQQTPFVSTNATPAFTPRPVVSTTPLHSQQPQHQRLMQTPSAMSVRSAKTSVTAYTTMSVQTLLDNDARSMLAMGGVPADIKEILDNDVNFEATGSYRMLIDAAVQMCVLVLVDRVYIWSYKCRDGDKTPLFMGSYDVPGTDEDYVMHEDEPVPLVQLVHGQGDQVGLMVCTVEGRLRFWDNLVMERQFKDAQVPLQPGHAVVQMKADTFGCILASDHGQVYVISVRSGGRSQTLNVVELTRPRSLMRWFSTPQGSANESQAVALVCGSRGRSADGNREVYLFSRSDVQCWQLSRHLTDKHIFQQSLTKELLQELQTLCDAHERFNSVYIFGAQMTKDGRVVVLALAQSDAQPDNFQAFLVPCEREDGKLKFLAAKLLTYRIPAEQIDSLDFTLDDHGVVAYVSTQRMLMVSVVDGDVDYDECIPFRQDAEAWICAMSTALKRGSVMKSDTSTLWAFLQPLGVIRLDVHLSQVKRERQLGARRDEIPKQVSNHIRSLLEQAVFFGRDAEV